MQLISTENDALPQHTFSRVALDAVIEKDLKNRLENAEPFNKRQSRPLDFFDIREKNAIIAYHDGFDDFNFTDQGLLNCQHHLDKICDQQPHWWREYNAVEVLDFATIQKGGLISLNEGHVAV